MKKRKKEIEREREREQRKINGIIIKRVILKDHQIFFCSNEKYNYMNQVDHDFSPFS